MSARKKAAAPKKKEPAAEPRKTVTYDQVSTLAMVAGGEKKYSTVIHNGVMMEWVGIGWVGGKKARAEDYDKYPEVVDKKQTKKRRK